MARKYREHVIARGKNFPPVKAKFYMRIAILIISTNFYFCKLYYLEIKKNFSGKC